MGWNPLKLRDFCYFYSVMVGVFVVSSTGICIMTIIVLVNIAGENNQPDSSIRAVNYVIVFLFAAVGFVAYTFGFIGAFQDNRGLMKAGAWVQLLLMIWWMVLTLMVFADVDANRYTCVCHRCADHLFIQETGWLRHSCSRQGPQNANQHVNDTLVHPAMQDENGNNIIIPKSTANPGPTKRWHDKGNDDTTGGADDHEKKKVTTTEKLTTLKTMTTTTTSTTTTTPKTTTTTTPKTTTTTTPKTTTTTTTPKTTTTTTPKTTTTTTTPKTTTTTTTPRTTTTTTPKTTTTTTPKTTTTTTPKTTTTTTTPKTTTTTTTPTTTTTTTTPTTTTTTTTPTTTTTTTTPTTTTTTTTPTTTTTTTTPTTTTTTTTPTTTTTTTTPKTTTTTTRKTTTTTTRKTTTRQHLDWDKRSIEIANEVIHSNSKMLSELHGDEQLPHESLFTMSLIGSDGPGSAPFFVLSIFCSIFIIIFFVYGIFIFFSYANELYEQEYVYV